MRLNRDTPVTCSHRRNRERGIRHGVEHSNDLTDRVVARRDGYFFTFGVGGHIGRIHIVEHDWVWPKQNIHGSNVKVPIVVKIDPFERAIPWRALDKHGVVHDLLCPIVMTLLTCIDNCINKCPQKRTMTGLSARKKDKSTDFKESPYAKSKLPNR